MITVLSIGQLWEGGTCLERAKVLAAMGWRVDEYDVTPYLSAGSRIRSALQNRMLMGPDIRRLNNDLLNFVEEKDSYDVVWVDKGRWIYPESLERIKRGTGAMLIHYTPDPAFTVHTSRHFMQGIKLYDLCITTKRYELEAYEAAGAKKVVFTWQGVDDRFIWCKPCSDLAHEDREGLVFIGHCEPHYVETLVEVAGVGLPLRIWGNGWGRAARKYPVLAPCVQGEGVYGEVYPHALATGRIGIGLLSKMCPDAFTTRTFEIPAAGCLLLGERTDEHLELFEEGKEAEFYSNNRELIEKAHFYLENDEQRSKVSALGREKTLKNYTWAEVLQPVVEEIHEYHGHV